jgi:hypothetical protein
MTWLLLGALGFVLVVAWLWYEAAEAPRWDE